MNQLRAEFTRRLYCIDRQKLLFFRPDQVRSKLSRLADNDPVDVGDD